MKKKIQEVQNYFADKIARGLYKVTKISEHTVDVVVDRKYKFCLWVANGPESFMIWIHGDNFMVMDFTDAQKATAHKKAVKFVTKWVDTEKREKELAELKRLQEKYQETVK